MATPQQRRLLPMGSRTSRFDRLHGESRWGKRNGYAAKKPLRSGSSPTFVCSAREVDPSGAKTEPTRRKSDVARKFPRARFLFRLNGRLPPGNGRRILPQKTLRTVLLLSLTFFSIWAAKSAGKITEGTQPKWRVVRLVRYDRFSFRSGSRLRRSENAQPTESVR